MLRTSGNRNLVLHATRVSTASVNLCPYMSCMTFGSSAWSKRFCCNMFDY